MIEAYGGKWYLLLGVVRGWLRQASKGGDDAA